MTKLTAAQFRHLIGCVDYAITSLVSCLPHEIDNEARILRRALAELCAAELARKNDRLSAQREQMIRWANETLARRSLKVA